MKLAAVIVAPAVVSFAAAQQDNSTSSSQVCWKDSYGRGVGRPITTCAEGLEQDGLLCYPPCRDGYAGVGPVCWQRCSSFSEPGLVDTGAFCQRNLYITSANNGACPWYDVCGLTFAKGCSTCPDTNGNGISYINDGCTCRIPPRTYTKDSYGRGAGVPLGCATGLEYDAGLCYESCDEDYGGVGPVCWQGCPASSPVNGGAICCESPEQCTGAVLDLALRLPLELAIGVITGNLSGVMEILGALLPYLLPEDEGLVRCILNQQCFRDIDLETPLEEREGFAVCLLQNDCIVPNNNSDGPPIDILPIIDCINFIPVFNPEPPCAEYANVLPLLGCVALEDPKELFTCVLDNIVLSPGANTALQCLTDDQQCGSKIDIMGVATCAMGCPADGDPLECVLSCLDANAEFNRLKCPNE